MSNHIPKSVELSLVGYNGTGPGQACSDGEELIRMWLWSKFLKGDALSLSKAASNPLLLRKIADRLIHNRIRIKD